MRENVSGHPWGGEVPLVMGTFLGLRSWNLDPQGFINSPVSHHSWKPGENQATCIMDDWRNLRPHVATTQCSCGFYAYFCGGDLAYGSIGSQVIGIMEGYGRTTYGTNGFRCSKGKILAIYNPHLIHSESWWNRWGRLVQFKDPKVARLWLFGMIVYVAIMMTGALTGTDFLIITGWIMTVAFWLGIIIPQWSYAWRARKVKTAFRLANRSYHVYLADNTPKKRFDLMAMRYPEIKQYASFRQMIRDYPPTTYDDISEGKE